MPPFELIPHRNPISPVIDLRRIYNISIWTIRPSMFLMGLLNTLVGILFQKYFFKFSSTEL